MDSRLVVGRVSSGVGRCWSGGRVGDGELGDAPRSGHLERGVVSPAFSGLLLWVLLTLRAATRRPARRRGTRNCRGRGLTSTPARGSLRPLIYTARETPPVNIHRGRPDFVDRHSEGR